MALAGRAERGHGPTESRVAQAHGAAEGTRGGLTRQRQREDLAATRRRGTSGQFADWADTSFSRFMDVAAMSAWM